MSSFCPHQCWHIAGSTHPWCLTNPKIKDLKLRLQISFYMQFWYLPSPVSLSGKFLLWFRNTKCYSALKSMSNFISYLPETLNLNFPLEIPALWTRARNAANTSKWRSILFAIFVCQSLSTAQTQVMEWILGDVFLILKWPAKKLVSTSSNKNYLIVHRSPIINSVVHIDKFEMHKRPKQEQQVYLIFLKKWTQKWWLDNDQY